MKRDLLTAGIGLCTAVAGLSSAAQADGTWRPIRMKANGSTTATGDVARSNNEWRATLEHQQTINRDQQTGGPAANDEPRFIGSQDVLDDAIAEVAALQARYGEATWKDHWDESFYFRLYGDSLAATQKNGYLTRLDYILEDQYDVHGFNGIVKLTGLNNTSLFHVFTWTYSGPRRPDTPLRQGEKSCLITIS